MRKDDVDQVILIHAKAFGNFFLTRLGPRFLKAYYHFLLDFHRPIAVVAEASGSVVGFAVGFANPGEFYREFSARKRTLAHLVIFAAIRSPSLLPQIWNNFKRIETAVRYTDGDMELASIAVAVQGTGLGALVLERFIEVARLAKGKQIVLTTDELDNNGVRMFYEKRGFVLQGIENRGGRRLCRYVLKLAAG